MAEILIAGGGGLSGLNTARELARQGASVVITARQINPRVEKFIEEFADKIVVEPVNLASSAEVSDLFSRYRFEGIIYAAQAHQVAQTRAANHANYAMILNCLQAAEAFRLKRFVFVSSIAAYAGLSPPFVEDTPFPVQAILDDSPDALFAITGPDGSRQIMVPTFEVAVKRALEHIVLDYASPMQMGLSARPRDNQKLNRNQMNVSVLRISTQFGPGYTNMGSPISLAVHTLAGKGSFMDGTGYGGAPIPILWNMIAGAPLLYVRDTATALVTMMQRDRLAHQVYNLSSGYTTSPREQFKALCSVKPDAVNLLKIDPETLREEPFPTTTFNADRLTTDTGWVSGYSLETAIEDYLMWLERHNY